MMKDGHLGKCKECTKKDVADRYRSPEGREKCRRYEVVRFQTKERKRKTAEYLRRYRLRYPEKYHARCAVSNAVRDGKLKREPCELCGAEKTQAHHEDYSKPLEVRWFCFKCHREHAHGQIVGYIQLP